MTGDRFKYCIPLWDLFEKRAPKEPKTCLPSNRKSQHVTFELGLWPTGGVWQTVPTDISYHTEVSQEVSNDTSCHAARGSLAAVLQATEYAPTSVGVAGAALWDHRGSRDGGRSRNCDHALRPFSLRGKRGTMGPSEEARRGRDRNDDHALRPQSAWHARRFGTIGGAASEAETAMPTIRSALSRRGRRGTMGPSGEARRRPRTATATRRSALSWRGRRGTMGPSGEARGSRKPQRRPNAPTSVGAAGVAPWDHRGRRVGGRDRNGDHAFRPQVGVASVAPWDHRGRRVGSRKPQRLPYAAHSVS